jgi:cob(I)alamin adenosyltransferase
MKKSISTKKGDLGYSSLINGKKILKSETIFEILGKIDKLSVFCGLAIINLKKNKEIEIIQFLQELQKELYLISGQLAGCQNCEIKFLNKIEEKNNEIEKEIGDLNNFVFNSEFPETIYFDLLRINCRSVERLLVKYFYQNHSEIKNLLPIFNRLSDYFFLEKLFLQKKYNLGTKNLKRN